MSRGVGQERVARAVLAAVLAAQAGLVALHLWFPGWDFVNLGREANLPTWFHAGLLAGVGLLALDILRLEARLLGRAGRGRGWALTWLAVACAFGYLALDEGLEIHERLYVLALWTWLAFTSPLRYGDIWFLVFLPPIVAVVALVLAAFGARARLSRPLLVWGSVGLLLWVVAVTLEGTQASFALLKLHWLEVILEETAESLGTTCFGWAIWRYRRALTAWLRAPGATGLPGFAVPWRWVGAGSLALVVPAALVGGSIFSNAHVHAVWVGHGYAAVGRFEEAVAAYQAALTRAPEYQEAWNGLGVAEFRRGNLEAAERAFARSERLEARSAGVARNRGMVLLSLGRPAEAVDALTRAVALNPSDASAYRSLGLALRRLGREEEARAALARAAALRADRPR